MVASSPPQDGTTLSVRLLAPGDETRGVVADLIDMTPRVTRIAGGDARADTPEATVNQHADNKTS
jgi:hypothetical protein